VLTLIGNLNITKSPGTDNIGAKLVRKSADAIIDPLVYIYNLSSRSGIVPNELTIARVFPIHQKGDTFSPGNYRLISLLSTFDKLLEKLMHSIITCTNIKYYMNTILDLGLTTLHHLH
jgi:hypothetical protein